MTDESQALAQELMAITHAADKTVALLRKMFDGADMPSLDAFIDVDALRQRIQSEGVQIYAEVYSESEMRAAIAFHTSPVGQSVAAKTTLVEQRMQASLEAYLSVAVEHAP